MKGLIIIYVLLGVPLAPHRLSQLEVSCNLYG